jgi:TRAP-type mannitol/chloroaromatic compound transport system substrate-binding protein
MVKKYYIFSLFSILILLTVAFGHSQDKGKIKKLKVVSVYSRDMPIFNDCIKKFVADFNVISKELEIEVFAAGEYIHKNAKGEFEKIESSDVFDAVSEGKADMGFGAPIYWSEKVPGSDFMYAVPFGLSAVGMNAWLYRGGGLELWKELFGKKNLIPIPIGNTGGAMGGWFNKKIENIDDFKNLKIRMIGFYAKVLEKLEAESRWMLAPEAFAAYEKGEINAIVCQGPFIDQYFRFYRGPKYYYYPGWQEPGGVLALIINKDVWDNLDPRQREMIRIVAGSTYQFTYYQFFRTDSNALQELLEQRGVKLMRFPASVLDRLKELSKVVLEEEAAKNSQFKRAYEAFKKFKEHNNEFEWSRILNDAVDYETTASKFVKKVGDSEVSSVRAEGNNSVVISLSGDASFNPGEFEPRSVLSDEIARITKILDDYSIRLIRVEGHTDSMGNDYNNWQLSKDRANAVLDLLKKNEKYKNLIKAIAYGEDSPIADNNTPEGRRKNRRVEIVIEF